MGKLLISLSNIRQPRKNTAVTNTPAYFVSSSVMKKKESFIKFAPGAYNIKLIMAVIFQYLCKMEMFVFVGHFHPSLIFEDMARSLPLEGLHSNVGLQPWLQILDYC
jgi:hypothetical protein